MFLQVTIDANDPPLLARFWASALGYAATPPDGDTAWWAHYRGRLDPGEAGFDDRLFPPDGVGPAVWFQAVPETKAGKNRIHLDVYVTDRDDALSLAERIEVVERKVAELEALGGTVVARTASDPDDLDDVFYFVGMQDPEGNELDLS